MSLGYDEIAANLVIYERDLIRYTRCLARGNEVQVSARPEEVVRQTILYHILNRSGLCPECVYVRAETQHLDVALYKPPADERFRLSRGPIAIIEVKRRESHLPDHEQQLLDYLATYRGSVGFLYNGDVLFAYERGQAGWAARQLSTLADLDSLVKSTASQYDPDYVTFQLAAEGDFESFLRLAQAYGRYTLHNFTFTLKNDPNPIAGCCFRIRQGVVHYDVCGIFTMKQVPCFHPDQFGQLLSVIY